MPHRNAAWPIVIVRAPPVFDANAVQTMMQGLDRVLERRTLFTLLVDARRIVRPPNAVERKALAVAIPDSIAKLRAAESELE